jgi:signal transduction histidine kinase
MELELTQLTAAWPFGASLVAVAAQSLYVGRRRAAINEALHELRRPLQALALATPAAGHKGGAPLQDAVEIAAGALERLEGEVNGRPLGVERAPVRVRPLVDAAIARWRTRAGLHGGALSLRWAAAEPAVLGDRCALAQALDNLILNAIEHGGPEVVLEAQASSGSLEISVTDSGSGPCSSRSARSLSRSVARLSGRQRRGHGLRVVARTAAAHGGAFRLSRSEQGTRAALELPLPAGGGA